ncbi:MAG: sugar phosphate isomerase/epimerase [Lachnospiraceae bacterium]|nr:sugar phosphate isomerase/epimerase [Lachnospiraceae bacterium]
MAKFIMSAFADEASSNLDEQITELKKANVSMIELRGVDGVNCADLTIEDAKRIKQKLDANNIRLSALGSPYGKIGIEDPFEEHLEKLKKSIEVCKILECNKIRMFSFYLPKDCNPVDYRDKVLMRLEKMLDVAEREGIKLCHENEKGIYGDTAVRCRELYDYFGGRLGIIFDPANYIQCDVDSKEAYALQKDTITYFHMKDALKQDGSVVSVGNGDGSVPEILEDVFKSRNDEVILTVEPHLHVFNGLTDLQSEELQHKESYPDSKTAFSAACNAVKHVIDFIGG